MPRSGSSDALKLHLGCGAVSPPEWVNIDYSWNARFAKIPGLRAALAAVGVISSGLSKVAWSTDVLCHDLTKRLPFSDATAQYIYSSHCLEHLTRTNAAKLLSDCRRVLKPGGVIRLVVPDLLCLATAYVKTADSHPAEATERFLLDLTVFPHDEPNPIIRLYRTVHNANHKWMYDEALLRRDLQRAGFSDVTRRQFQDSLIPNIERVEVAQHRFEKSFCLEAIAKVHTA